MQNPVIFLVVADDVFTLLMMPNSCVPRDIDSTLVFGQAM